MYIEINPHKEKLSGIRSKNRKSTWIAYGEYTKILHYLFLFIEIILKLFIVIIKVLITYTFIF